MYRQCWWLLLLFFLFSLRGNVCKGAVVGVSTDDVRTGVGGEGCSY